MYHKVNNLTEVFPWKKEELQPASASPFPTCNHADFSFYIKKINMFSPLNMPASTETKNISVQCSEASG